MYMLIAGSTVVGDHFTAKNSDDSLHKFTLCGLVPRARRISVIAAAFGGSAN